MEARGLVLPRHDLVEAIDLHDPERGGELVQPEVEPVDGVVRFAVVPERARELDGILVTGDEHPALTRRDRLRRREGPHADVAEHSAAPAVPLGAVRVGAVLEQEDSLAAAEVGDPLGIEREMAADVHEERSLGPVRVDLALEVFEGHAEVVAVAVDELHACARGDRCQGRCHEAVRGAEHGLPANACPLEGCERGARPAVERHPVAAVPARPRRFELPRQLAFRPLVRVEDPLPERVHPRPVALVEPDGKPREVGGDPGG